MDLLEIVLLTFLGTILLVLEAWPARIALCVLAVYVPFGLYVIWWVEAHT